MKPYLVVAGLLSLIASPAFAGEFYVAKDQTTEKCEIVEIKPDGKTMIMIGSSSYATEDEARAARSKATVEECPHKPGAQ